MDLNNEFVVDAPIEEAWTTLIDVEKIAPCLPGAQLQEIEGDEFRGIVKVKVGPITAQYKGKAVFVERNDAEHRAVLQADGRDTRGAGNASALITAQLTAQGDQTHVSVVTDLKVTGKVAQFGRGVMADVSAKIMDQFATNLGELMAAESSAPEAAAPADSAPASDSAGASDTVRKINQPEVEAVDLLDTAGAPVMKRLAPVLGIGLLLLILRRILKSRAS